jgi:hypothetical protein
LVLACCRIEERMAADCHPGIGLGDVAELGTDIALARIGADSFRKHTEAGLELGPHRSSIACMIEGTPASTITLPIQKAGRARHLVEDEIGSRGMRVIRMRASVIRRRSPSASRAGW